MELEPDWLSLYQKIRTFFEHNPTWQWDADAPV
jgi:hypothetical protein